MPILQVVAEGAYKPQMSKMSWTICKKHPKYQVKRKPATKCRECVLMWMEKSLAGDEYPKQGVR
jgi:hypothetical protein